MQDPNSCCLRNTSPIHVSMEQNTAFANSNIWVVRLITRFDSKCLSYVLGCLNCNKLIITWPGGCSLLYCSWPLHGVIWCHLMSRTCIPYQLLLCWMLGFQCILLLPLIQLHYYVDIITLLHK